MDSNLGHANPYCGSDTKLQKTGLGQDPDVVLSLMDKRKLNKRSALTMENFIHIITTAR